LSMARPAIHSSIQGKIHVQSVIQSCRATVH
jgi:hypothetical protein